MAILTLQMIHTLGTNYLRSTFNPRQPWKVASDVDSATDVPLENTTS
jgi:hypothetical protein